MSKFRVDVKPGNGQAEQAAAPSPEEARGNDSDFTTEVATIGVVAIGAAIFSVELIPGLALGVAAALAPRFLPRIGVGVQPLFDSTVRGAYKLSRKARSAFGEFQERVNDISAEVKAEEAAAENAAANEPKAPAQA
ncbi:MAG TPA: DUF5132 domain-containing protein [Methylocella sp.]|nr:DUF5132 domain-containing protein [Methylocella sp.]